MEAGPSAAPKVRMRVNLVMSALLASLLATPAARADAPEPSTASGAPATAAAPAGAPPQPAAAGQSGTAAAPEPGGGAATKEEVRALAEELRRLKLEMGLADVEYQSYGGMGPAASKVYYAPKGLSLGGYGEFYYRNRLESAPTDDSDLYRVVLYTGYRFTPRILFNAEVEYEHHDELSVEFAYLDFLLSQRLAIRVGSVLVPIGFVNEMHEPPFFNGVFRPEVERNLIPSTWNENGVGLHGAAAGLRYKAYLLVGLDATGGELSAGTWLRGARTGGGESPAETFAGVLNLGYDLGPATVGGTVYGGRAGQGAEVNGEKVHANVLLAEAHAQAAWRGFTARALFALGRLGDADLVSAAQGIDAPDQVIGSRTRGGYVEVAYDLLPLLAPDAGQTLAPFARWETLDLHAGVPKGGVRNPAFDATTWTAGLTYKPIPQVVVKADWQRREDGLDDVAQQVNVGAGFMF